MHTAGARVEDKDCLHLCISMQAFIQAQAYLKCRVNHIVMEYSPGGWEVNDRWSEYGQLSQMLMMLLKQNYTMLHISDDISRAPLLEMPSWKGRIGNFQEVVMGNLQYDASDAQLLKKRSMGCPKPKQLQSINA